MAAFTCAPAEIPVSTQDFDALRSGSTRSPGANPQENPSAFMKVLRRRLDAEDRAQAAAISEAKPGPNDNSDRANLRFTSSHPANSTADSDQCSLDKESGGLDLNDSREERDDLQSSGVQVTPVDVQGPDTLKAWALSIPGLVPVESISNEIQTGSTEFVSGNEDSKEENEPPDGGASVDSHITNNGLLRDAISAQAQSLTDSITGRRPAADQTVPPRTTLHARADAVNAEAALEPAPALDCTSSGLIHASEAPDSFDPVVLRGQLRLQPQEQERREAGAEEASGSLSVKGAGRRIGSSLKEPRVLTTMLPQERRQGDPPAKSLTLPATRPQVGELSTGTSGTSELAARRAATSPSKETLQGAKSLSRSKDMGEPASGEAIERQRSQRGAPDFTPAPSSLSADRENSATGRDSRDAQECASSTPAQRALPVAAPAAATGIPMVALLGERGPQRGTASQAELGRLSHPSTAIEEGAEPFAARSSLRELNVRLETGTGRVDMRFVETGGAVNLRLRTPNLQIADGLRGDISRLESDLASRGWSADLDTSADTSDGRQGLEPTDVGPPGRRSITTRGLGVTGSPAQDAMASGQHSESSPRERDWQSDEQELLEMAALRRLAVKGGPR